MPRKVGGLIRMWKEIESDPDAVTPNKSHCVVRSQSSPEGVMGWESDGTTESGCRGAGAGRQGFGGGTKMPTDGFEGRQGLRRRRLRITRRQDEQTLIQRFVNERMKEVELLKERRAVSEFAHRKKIQNFLIFKSSQKFVAFSDHRPQSTAEEINQLNREIAIFYLRRQFSPRAHRSGTPVTTVENKSVFPTHLSNHTSSDSKICETRGNISHRTCHICTTSPIVEKKSMVDQLNLPKKSLNSENSEIREKFITKANQCCIPLSTVEKESVFPIHLSKNSLDSESCESREQFCPGTHQIGKSSSIYVKTSLLPVHLSNNPLDTESSERKRKFIPRVQESCTSTPVEKKNVLPTHLSNHSSSNSNCFEIKGQFSSMTHQSCIPSPAAEKKSMFQVNVSKKSLDSKNCEIGQQFSARAQRSCTSTPTVEKKSMFHLNLLKKSFDSKSCGSRQQFSRKQQQTCTSTPTIEDSSVLHTPLSDSYLHSNFHKIRQQFSPRPPEKCVEAIGRYLDDIIQPEEGESVNSRRKDFQESSSQHSDLAWEEGERSDDSSSLHSGQDETDIYNNEQIGESDGMCFPGGFSSQRNINGHRKATLDGFSETHSVSSEIDELKTRQKVTTISSDFREELNKVILSSLQKQWRNEENYVLNDECQPLESLGSINDDQSIKMEAIFDMRNDIANIHNEISNLRKLLTGYMQRSMVEHPVHQQQDDATAAAPSIVSMGRPSVSSEWEPINKGSCGICYENQIDSLLYRCGHLCTCYKCATELLWSSGRCPVCKIPIVDVVRAYSHS